MKSIIIAAGYATRLGELTKNFPKPLLKIGDNTILGRMLDDIDTIPQVDEHIIVTNHKFAPIFEEWAKQQHYTKPLTIIDDGTETNDTRLGAVCDLLLAIDHIDKVQGSTSQPLNPSTVAQQHSPAAGLQRINSCDSSSQPQLRCPQPREAHSTNHDILVLAADNLLFFSFQEFVDFAMQKQTSCIMCHEQPSIEKLQRTGVIVMDEQNRVLNMEEKPQQPKSHWAVPPFYIYLQKDIDLVRHSVENGCGKDAPGNLAHYMVEKTDMHAWPMSAGRFDIGSLDTYYEACEKFG